MKNIFPIISILIFLFIFSFDLTAQMQLEGTDPSCGGSDGTLTVTGLPSGVYTYYWSDDTTGAFLTTGNRQNLSGGTYTVNVYDNVTNCSGTASKTLEAAATIIANIDVEENSTVLSHPCDDGPAPKLTLLGYTSGDPGVFTHNFDDNMSKEISSGGDYEFIVTSEDNCVSTATIKITEIQVQCSSDPNDITGPEGYGPEKWVSINDNLNYHVRFENDPVLATAAALRVTVDVPLDEHVNPQSLRIGDFGFANMNFTVPENQVFYSTQLDVRDSLDIYVQVTAGIDLVNNKAFWILESIDPLTGLNPTSPDLGLLPVNDTITRRGEGYINFSIRPKETTVTRDSIVEFANIIFDNNEAILTNRAVNLVDAFPPISNMDPIVADSTDSIITLSWSGVDDTDGVGVSSYALYFSKNGIPFQLYEDEITATSIQFPIAPNTSYSFYTIATDFVGNREAPKTIGDVTFESASVPSLSFLSPLGGSFCQGDSVSIAWTSFEVGNVNILFSQDGVSYNPIALNVDSSTQDYVYVIPTGISCENCQLQLVSTAGEAESRSNAFGIFPPPSISAGQDSSVCLGESITLQASGGSSYNWTASNSLNNTNTATPIATPTETTTYYVQGTDSNGCRNSDGITIVVHDLPEVSFLPFDTEVCANEAPLMLSGNPVGGNVVGYTVENNILDPQIAGAGTYVLTYLYTNGNGCNGTANQSITIDTVPVVEFTGLENQYLESDEVATLLGNPVGGEFSGPGMNDNIFDPSVATPGIHDITYSFQDDNLCEAIYTQQVTVYGSTTVFMTGLEDQYCENESAILLTGNPVGGTFSGQGISDNNFNPAVAGVGTHEISYTSNGESDVQTVMVLPTENLSIAGLQDSFCIAEETIIINGNPVGGILSGDGVDGNYFDLTTAGVGIHNITYTFENTNGCISTESKTVTILDLPVVSFTGLDNFYNDTDAVVILEGIPAGGTFIGNGIVDNTFDPSLANNGYNTITYKYTDMFGCPNTYSQDTEVYAPNAAFISGLSTFYCENDESVNLIGNPVGGEFSGPGMTENTFNPMDAGEGGHTITYTYTDVSGALVSIANNTIVDPIPEITFNNASNIFCITDATITLDATPYGGEWSGIGVTDFAFNPEDAGVGTHTINYTYMDESGAGCSNSLDQVIVVGDIVAASVENLDSIYCIDNEEVLLTMIPAGGVLSGNGIVNETFHPSLAGAGEHLITYTYQDPEGGCMDEYITTVLVTNSVDGMSIVGIDSLYCLNAGATELTGFPAGGTFSGPAMVGNIFTPTEEGNTTITYTVSDGFCEGSYSIDVLITSALALEIEAFPSEVVCEGNSIMLRAAGDGEFIWSTGEDQENIFVTTPGNYSVTTTDINGCATSSMISVDFYEATIPEITLLNDTLYASTASTYQWYLDFTPIENATNSFFNPDVDGIYTVITTDANGCTGHSEPFDFITTYVQDLAIENLVIHPNPIIEYVDIQFVTSVLLSNLKIGITDVKGVLIMEQFYGDTNNIFQERLDLSEIPAGVYFLNIISDEGSFIEKIVVIGI